LLTQSVDGPKILVQVLDQIGYVLNVAEIERDEVQRSRTGSFSLLNGARQVIVHLPRHCDRAVALQR